VGWVGFFVGLALGFGLWLASGAGEFSEGEAGLDAAALVSATGARLGPPACGFAAWQAASTPSVTAHTTATMVFLILPSPVVPRHGVPGMVFPGMPDASARCDARKGGSGCPRVANVRAAGKSDLQ
jgi:hypothetical protein